MKNSFTAVFFKTGTWYSAFVLEIPGANTQGKTLREARANLRDAISELFAANRELVQKDLPKGNGYIKEKLAVAV